MTGRRRSRPAPQFEDFGTPERLARGEIIVTGERPRRQGRAVTVLMRFGQREQTTAMWLLLLFEKAHFPGYSRSGAYFDSTGGGWRDLTPAESAVAARRTLARVEKRLTREHWSVLWYVLFMSECQALYAVRVRCRKADVRPLLQAALLAVAGLR